MKPKQETTYPTTSNDYDPTKDSTRLAELNKKLQSKHPIASGNFGPVKIVVIDRKKFYCYLIILSILLILTHLSIGALNIVVLEYTLKSGDTHAILCTVGLHLFCIEAVMSLVYGRVWMNLFFRHKKLTHFILNLCGLICSVTGTVLSFKSGMPKKPHGIMGLTAIITTVITAILGLFALLENKKRLICPVMHACFGIASLLFSTISLILGLIYSGTAFKKHHENTTILILVILVSIYTTVLFVLILRKLIVRIR